MSLHIGPIPPPPDARKGQGGIKAYRDNVDRRGDKNRPPAKQKGLISHVEASCLEVQD